MKKQLENGLILQDLSEDFDRDKDRLPLFCFHGFEQQGDIDSNWAVMWVNDLINVHPYMSREDFIYIIDPANDNKIVSATILIPQTWRYGGIEFAIGRPEMVATLPDYRRRGLVREIFKEIHARSTAEGQLAQVITGIQNFYRQFGYTTAVPFGTRATIPYHHIPELKEGETAHYTLRPVTIDDIPTLMRLDNIVQTYSLLSVVRDETIWKYEINGRNANPDFDMRFFLILDATGESIGYTSIGPTGYSKLSFSVRSLVLSEKVMIFDVYEDLLRAFKEVSAQFRDSYSELVFAVAMPPMMTKLLQHHYGVSFIDDASASTYYFRIPDLSRFLTHIAPVLEARLENSALKTYTGVLSFNMYQPERFLVMFEQGKLISATYGDMPESTKARMNIPWDLFLNMLLSYQSYADIDAYRSDVQATAYMIVLVDILFPKQPSALVLIA